MGKQGPMMRREANQSLRPISSWASVALVGKREGYLPSKESKSQHGRLEGDK